MRTVLISVLSLAAALAGAGRPVFAQEAREAPLGLVTAAKGGSVLRAGNSLPLAARPGDILFANDALRAENGSVTFIACNKNTQQSLSPDGDVLLEAAGPKLRAGKFLDQKNVGGCFLPPVPRTIVAAQAHSGAAMLAERTRDMPAPTFEQMVQSLEPARQAQLKAALAPIDQAIQSNPADTIKRLERARVLDSYGLKDAAAAEMSKVAEAWPEVAWPKERLFVLKEDEAKSKVAAGESGQPDVPGQTYALLVGISKFKDQRINQLEFAHEDARTLTTLFESERGGHIPQDNVVLLMNEQATRAAIQAAIETHLEAKAGKNDTVILFIAAHGALLPDKKGYIVAYDTSAEDVATTGIPMDDISKLFATGLSKAKRLLLFVDVCHAGKIGQIVPSFDPKHTADLALASQADNVQISGILAAKAGQTAKEGPQWGGGHGAFTYFLMSGMNGKADINTDKRVDMQELFDYVKDNVQASTANSQVPKEIGDVEASQVVAFTDLPGITLADYTGETKVASRSLTKIPRPTLAVPLTPPPSAASTTQADLRRQNREQVSKEFEDALVEGRVLSTADRNAFVYLEGLRQRLQPADYLTESSKLQVALEDRGQEVLLTYLAGEQTPQKRDDFVNGEIFFREALTLAPNSLLLQARALFCQGRVAIFDKDYPRAASLLEQSIKLDSERGYSYNALGISYLERADYDNAILAFRDATARAPYWAYPQHNLALAYVEKGDYNAAIATYQHAMQLIPNVAYLPYNLGLVYQRMNRPKDAEAMYNVALRISPDNPQTFTALGYLRASQGKRADAEKYYRQALAKDPELLVARHDLALLLSTMTGRTDEAVALWRENLTKNPDYVASRLSLAHFLARTGQDAAAATEYETLVKSKPDYIAARLELADVDARLGKRDEALVQLREVIRQQPQNADAYERAGDVEKAAGRPADAAVDYQKALANTTDGSVRKRIQKKSRQ